MTAAGFAYPGGPAPAAQTPRGQTLKLGQAAEAEAESLIDNATYQRIAQVCNENGQ